MFLAVALSMLLAPAALSAQEAETASAKTAVNTGELALPFSRYGHNPVTDAMGGADILSTSSLAWASYSNVAALPFSEKRGDVGVSYQLWNPHGTDYFSVGGGFNLRNKIGITAGITGGIGNLRDVVINGENKGKYRQKDFQFNAGVSWRFVDFLSAGANVRYIGEKSSSDFSAGTISSDIYLMFDLWGIKAAAGVTNLGGRISDLDNFSLPSSATLAIGYDHTFNEVHYLEVEAKGDYYFANKKFDIQDPLSFSVGAGYSYRDRISVRGGYHYGDKKSVLPSYGTAGIGTEFIGIHLDLTYYIATKESPLRNNLSIGIGYRF